MRHFHGDLLMGGAAIREIDGELDDRPTAGRLRQAGAFVMDAPQRSLMELGRPYLLLTDQGESVELVVTDIGTTADAGRVRVEFQATGNQESRKPSRSAGFRRTVSRPKQHPPSHT